MARDLGEVRREYNERCKAAGICRQCNRQPAAVGRTRCSRCGAIEAARERARHVRVYVSRRWVGLDGVVHNRCRRCQRLGHTAKTCGR